MRTPSWLPKLAVFAVAVLAVAVTAACGSPGDSTTSTGQQTVRFGQVGGTATLWPVYVGRAKNFFANHQVDVQISGTGSSSGTAQQIVAGAQDIGSAGLPDFVRAINAGAALTMFASGVAETPYTMIGGKDVSGWADLKGKKIILGGPQDVTRYYFDAAAAAHGLTDKDFTLVYAGATSNRFAALSSGSVSAAILGPPFDAKALSAGYRDLGKMAQYVPGQPFTGLAVSKKWAGQHKPALVDFLHGYLESIAWLRNPANRDEAARILAQATNTSVGDATVTYDYYRSIDAFPADGRINGPGFEKLLAGLASSGYVPNPPKPPATYVDSQYIDSAAQHG